MKNNYLKIVHFSSFLPKRCGIATYTQALIKTIENNSSKIKNEVIAIDDIKDGYKYPSIVKYHFWDKDIKKYKKAAEFINNSDTDIVNIQHEFGLYGARVKKEFLGKNDGKNFLLFLNNLRKPVVTTMHMVYKNPPKHHIQVVKQICEKSKKIVVLAKIAKKILVNRPYSINTNKIIYIPHGAPNVPKKPTLFYKKLFNFPEDSIIISSFGYIRSKKGYEYLIEAVGQLVKKYPKILLLVIGEVHPQRSPEYYQMLKEKVSELKIEKNILFIDKFIDYTLLLNYLMATNIFIAPFTVLDQVSSGTLIYAMAAGRACVATTFDYAKEALANRRGILISSKNSKKIAESIDWLIKHPKARHQMENKAYKYARNQIWSVIAKDYIKLFKHIIKNEK